MKVRAGLLLAAMLPALTGCIVVESSPDRVLHERVAGYRWEDGALRITTWGSCRRVARVEVSIEGRRFNTSIGRWTVRAHPAASLPDLTYGRAPRGFESSPPTRAQPNDRRAREAWVTVNPGPYQAVDHVMLGPLRAEQRDHPDQHEWYVNGRGWFTRNTLAEAGDDSTRVHPLCG